MKFKNPNNGYVEEVSDLVWLWVLLLGCVYFAVRGVWTHAVVGLVLAILTWGVSWLVYPFFARIIMQRHYLRRGWQEVSNPVHEPAATSASPVKRRVDTQTRRIYIASIVAAFVLVVALSFI